MIFARALAAALLAACLLATGAASAQTYPNRPITLLVPFPPGGATDTIARILQDPMQKALGQTIVIENVGGAGGMIAAARAARAEPDGYTIPDPPGGAGGRHVALSESHVRCGKGFRPHRPDQHRRVDACGAGERCRRTTSRNCWPG